MQLRQIIQEASGAYISDANLNIIIKSLQKSNADQKVITNLINKNNVPKVIIDNKDMIYKSLIDNGKRLGVNNLHLARLIAIIKDLILGKTTFVDYII
jgi:hypothetical protein